MNDLEARLRRPWPQEAAFSGQPMLGLAYPLSLRHDRPRLPSWSAVRSVVGLVGSTALIVAGVALLSPPPSQPMSVGLAGAANVMGVRPSAVVETGDGYVAARLDGGSISLFIAQVGSDGAFTVRRLGTQDVSTVAKPGASWGAFSVIECTGDSGLTWRRYGFGATVQPIITEPEPLQVVGITGRASVVANGQAFVVAFPPDSPDGTVKLRYQGSDGDYDLFSGTFPTANKCGLLRIT